MYLGFVATPSPRSQQVYWRASILSQVTQKWLEVIEVLKLLCYKKHVGLYPTAREIHRPLYDVVWKSNFSVMAYSGFDKIFIAFDTVEQGLNTLYAVSISSKDESSIQIACAVQHAVVVWVEEAIAIATQIMCQATRVNGILDNFTLVMKQSLNDKNYDCNRYVSSGEELKMNQFAVLVKRILFNKRETYDQQKQTLSLYSYVPTDDCNWDSRINCVQSIHRKMDRIKNANAPIQEERQ